MSARSLNGGDLNLSSLTVSNSLQTTSLSVTNSLQVPDLITSQITDSNSTANITFDSNGDNTLKIEADEGMFIMSVDNDINIKNNSTAGDVVIGEDSSNPVNLQMNGGSIIGNGGLFLESGSAGLFLKSNNTGGNVEVGEGASSTITNINIYNGSLCINLPLNIGGVTSNYFVKASPSSDIVFNGSTSSTEPWVLSENLLRISLPSFTITMTSTSYSQAIQIVLDVYIPGLVINCYNQDDNASCVFTNQIPGSDFGLMGNGTSFTQVKGTICQYYFSGNNIGVINFKPLIDA